MIKMIEKLLEIQDKDVRIFNLRKQIESVPVEKEKMMSVLTNAEADCEKEKHEALEIESKIKNVEIEISARKDKIHTLQTKSADIKKNEEYKAFLSEIDQLNKKISGFEDVQLEYLERLEAAKGKATKGKKSLEAAKARIDSAVKDFELRNTNCSKQVEKVSEERAQIAKEVPEDILWAYERIIINSAGLKSFRKGLVPLQNDNCGSCFLKVTPQIKNRVRKVQITSCENCGALLYFGE